MKKRRRKELILLVRRNRMRIYKLRMRKIRRSRIRLRTGYRIVIERRE